MHRGSATLYGRGCEASNRALRDCGAAAPARALEHGSPAGSARDRRKRNEGAIMRLAKPRIEPLPEAQWDDEVRELLEPARRRMGGVLNIQATLARHPKLLKRWNVFGNHVLFKSTLPERDREILILR